MTIFHLLYGVIIVIAFEQGRKAGVFGILIGLVIGAVAAWAFHSGNFMLFVWLPKRLGIYEIVRYREKTENALVAKEKVLSTIYDSITLFAGGAGTSPTSQSAR